VLLAGLIEPGEVGEVLALYAWKCGGIFKRTDDHIFEKTLKIEFSPIPQAYPLKRVSDLSCGRVVYRVE
jgi:hypothetical protein